MAANIPPKDYIDSVKFPAEITLAPIGVVRSPHRERHGTPHQAVLPADPAVRPEESCRIEVFPSRAPVECLRDLGEFEYVWVLAYLHLNRGFRPLLAPPRDPDRKHGVFATRAPHRPNPLGLSAARIVAVRGHCVHLERLDLLDGTPVLDLKPYVPYCDAFPEADAGWVGRLPRPTENDR